MLSHERLDVYRRSIEFLAAALRIAEKLPRGQAPLDVAPESEWAHAKALLVRVVEMLSKMS